MDNLLIRDRVDPMRVAGNRHGAREDQASHRAGPAVRSAATITGDYRMLEPDT